MIRRKLPIVLTVALVAGAWLVPADAVAEMPHQVLLLDATIIPCTVKSLSAGHVQVLTETGPSKIALKEIAQVITAEADSLAQANGARAIRTTYGDLLAASTINMKPEGETLKVQTSTMGQVDMPLSCLATIYFTPTNTTIDSIDARCEQLRFVSESFDMVVAVNKEGSWVGLESVFRGIDDKSVSFRWKEKDRNVKISSLRTVRLVVQKPQTDKILGTLTTTDGSQLRFSQVQFDGKDVTLMVPSIGQAKLPRKKMARIKLISSRLVELADLKPVKKTEEGFFDTTYPFRKNLAVSGKPMKLDGKKYVSGLGLHSYSELTWDLGGQYKTFVTLLGIDDAVRPRGNAKVTFLLDGKAKQSFDVIGTQKARIVRIDVQGVKQLTVRVDFGQDKLDSADHVDLADARLVK